MATDYAIKRDKAAAERRKNQRNNPQQDNMQAQMEQVNALFQMKLAEGMSPAQAVLSQPGDEDRKRRINGTYTVKSGDDLNKISGETGVNPQDLLAQNPDVSQIQTGMVLQYQQPLGPPKPAGYGTSVQNTPANPVTAQFGGLTPNVQGSEAWRIAQQNSGSMSYASQPKTYGPPKPAGYNGNNQPANNPFANVGQNNNAFSNFGQTSGLLTQGGQPGALPGSEAWRVQNAQNAGASPNKPVSSGGYVNGQNPYNGLGLDYQQQLVAERFMQQIKGQGLIPTNDLTRFLEINGYIRPVTQPTTQSQNWGNNGKRLANPRKGGGGGGGSSIGGAGRTVNTGGYQTSVPAFSGGGGLRPLINWRI